MMAIALALAAGVPDGLPPRLGEWRCVGTAAAKGASPLTVRVALRWKPKWEWLVSAAEGRVVASSDRRYQRVVQTNYSANESPRPNGFTLYTGDDEGRWMSLDGVDMASGRATFSAGHEVSFEDVSGTIDDYNGHCEMIR